MCIFYSERSRDQQYIVKTASQLLNSALLVTEPALKTQSRTPFRPCIIMSRIIFAFISHSGPIRSAWSSESQMAAILSEYIRIRRCTSTANWTESLVHIAVITTLDPRGRTRDVRHHRGCASRYVRCVPMMAALIKVSSVFTHLFLQSARRLTPSE